MGETSHRRRCCDIELRCLFAHFTHAALEVLQVFIFQILYELIKAFRRLVMIKIFRDDFDLSLSFIEAFEAYLETYGQRQENQ
jgi:hypothetical protein